MSADSLDAALAKLLHATADGADPQVAADELFHAAALARAKLRALRAQGSAAAAAERRVAETRQLLRDARSAIEDHSELLFSHADTSPADENTRTSRATPN